MFSCFHFFFLSFFINIKFEPYIETVFKKREIVGEIIHKYQKTKSKDYIPFDAICPRCGMLNNVDKVDIENKRVHFVCKGKPIKDRMAKGCGYEGWGEVWGDGWRTCILSWNKLYWKVGGSFGGVFKGFGEAS